MNKLYAVMNFETKRQAEIAAPSVEAALEQFCGEALGKPFHQRTGLRMYRHRGHIIGVGFAGQPAEKASV